MRYETAPLGIVFGPYGHVGYVGGPSDLSWIKILFKWLGIRPS